MTLWRDTLAALAAPRRAVPIALVVFAMTIAQWWFSQGAAATVLGLAMATTFVLTGPYAWRRLFPPGQPITAGRLLLYALVGTIPSLAGWLLPRLGDVPATFLSATVNTGVVTTLFWAGGWGLARDIELEASLQAAEARVEALARQAEQAELLALRAHLDPHFLFNTLNAIAEWTREDAEVAEAAILRLSALLREVMAGVRAPRWPLARELDVVRAVFELHAIRDPDRFRVSWALPDPLPAASVPPLLLLPLVENAVKHGPAAGHRGAMRFELHGPDPLRVRVCNPGPFTGRRAGGEGLALVERRLHLAYGDAATFTIEAVEGDTVATVLLPPEPP